MSEQTPIFVDDTGRRRRLVGRLAAVATALSLAYVLVLGATLVGAPGLGSLPMPGFADLREPAERVRTSVGDRTREELLPDLEAPAPAAPVSSTTVPSTGLPRPSTTMASPTVPSTSAPAPFPSTAPTTAPPTTATPATTAPGRASTTTTSVPPGRGSTTTTSPETRPSSAPDRDTGPPSSRGPG